LKKRRRVVKRRNLDELFPPRDARTPKHPDRALLLDDGEIVIVEETGRPEIKDVQRLERFLRDFDWKILFDREPRGKTLVLHYRRRDLKATKYLTYRSKEIRKNYGVVLYGAGCDKVLKERLRLTP